MISRLSPAAITKQTIPIARKSQWMFFSMGFMLFSFDRMLNLAVGCKHSFQDPSRGDDNYDASCGKSRQHGRLNRKAPLKTSRQTQQHACDQCDSTKARHIRTAWV
jgi:hypothetical protein